MPRLFTALEIPAPVADRLASLRGGLAGARWIDVENYHITLRFIGDIDNAAALEVYQQLARIHQRSFPVTIEALRVFGGAKPRALVACAKSSQPLLDLRDEQERLLRRIGIAPEPRKFTPHVTLARLKSASASAVADYLGTRGLFREEQFIVDRFVLFSSKESVGGGPYVIEAAYPLS